jgi:putative nucleotidyltransferase with HDIG domain
MILGTRCVRKAATPGSGRRYGSSVDLYVWAFEVCQAKLAEVLPRRWAHVQGVAERASSLAPIVGPEAETLRAAAVLHDVGYAPDIARSGFHPLDGANYLVRLGAPQQLVDLVAHHSGAAIEAKIRGLQLELSHFTDEETPLRDALWYCDLTTGPDGHWLSADERLAEIRQRYGQGHIVTRFVDEAWHELMGAVDRTEQRLRASK